MASAWMRQLYRVATFLLVLSIAPFAFAQDEAGGEDLEKAFELKINAESSRDLDEVADLCESAIEKGLEPESQASAEELLSSTLYEHADQLGETIFAAGGMDRRWRKFRREALSRLERVHELSPNLTDAWLLTARLQTLDGGDRDAAQSALDKVLEIAGDNAEQKSEAHLSLATLAAVNNDEEGLLSNLNKALEANPENVRAMQIRGDFYLQKGEPEKAVEDFKLWLKSDPENLDAYFRVATSMSGLEMYDEAIEIVNEAIAVKPEEIRCYIARARLNIDREDYKSAIEDATEALKLERRSREGLITRSEAYLLDGNYEEALEDTNEMLTEEPGLIAAIEMSGRIKAAQGDFGAAIEDFKTLSENVPDRIGYRLQLAQLYNAEDQPRQAITVYNRLLRQLPDDETFDEIRQMIFRGRGDARLSTGEHEKAVYEFNKALELDDTDDGTLNNLAWVLSTSPDDDVRDGERAIELATGACEITEYKEPHILSTLASAYAETGDFEKAKEWIEKGMEVNEEIRNKEVEGNNNAEELERIREQHESLQSELDFYVEEKPWREDQAQENKDKEEEGDKPEDEGDGSGEKEEMKAEDKDGDEQEGQDKDRDADNDTDNDAGDEDGDEDDKEGDGGDESSEETESKESEEEEGGGGGIFSLAA